jgi:hypothetical protein
MNSLKNITSGQEISCHSVATRYLLKNNFSPPANLSAQLLLRLVTAALIFLIILILLGTSVHAIQPAFIKGSVYNTYNNALLNGAIVSTRNDVSIATASGAFGLRVPPNIYTLLATASASCANLMAGIPATPGKIPFVKIGVSPASTTIGYVEGRIINAGSGDGIPGALIMTDTGGAAIASGQDGSYRLASPSGAATISITADGFSSKEIKKYTIYPYITTNLTISLAAASSGTFPVKGVITDACTGIRINNAVIVSNAGKIAISSDGFFSIDTPIGLSTIVVSRADDPDDADDADDESYQFSSKTFLLTPFSNTIQNFSLTHSKSGTGLVSGIITNIFSGEAIPGVKVESDTGSISYSQKDGTFKLYTSICTTSISASREGFTPVTKTVIVSQGSITPLNIPMNPLGSIAGFVRDSHTNTGIKDARIALAEDRTVSCKSSDDGSYVLSGISTGTYTIEISHPCYLPETRAAIQVTAGNTATEQFMLEASARATIHGSVRTFFARRPIPFALITSSAGASVATDADGIYTIELPACTTRITIRAPGFLPSTKRNISPADGETLELNVGLLSWPFRRPADREQSHVQ